METLEFFVCTFSSLFLFLGSTFLERNMYFGSSCIVPRRMFHIPRMRPFQLLTSFANLRLRTFPCFRFYRNGTRTGKCMRYIYVFIDYWVSTQNCDSSKRIDSVKFSYACVKMNAAVPYHYLPFILVCFFFVLFIFFFFSLLNNNNKINFTYSIDFIGFIDFEMFFLPLQFCDAHFSAFHWFPSALFTRFPSHGGLCCRLCANIAK